MQIAGNGGYDWGASICMGMWKGTIFCCRSLRRCRRRRRMWMASLSVVADANGTMTRAGVEGECEAHEGDVRGAGDWRGCRLRRIARGSTVYFTANSTLVGAKVDATGQARLTGDYPMQAKVTVAGLDIGKPMAMFGPGTMKAQSLIDGTATVSGPLKTPKELSGEAEFNQVDVKLQGIELKAAEPLRVGLRDGVATLEQVHITGQDTDMRASGTAQLFGVTDPKGGKLDVKAIGSVSMALLHTFDPDIISSGKVEFTVAAGGRVMNPALTGKVQFDKVNIAMDGVPNGLSNMNGTLVFNEDRLQVESLTATTGGGTLKIGGSIRYQERRLCRSDCDGRCGAGAAVWIERDGECEPEAAGQAAERAVERNDSDDAVWDRAGCGFCGVRVAGRSECAA